MSDAPGKTEGKHLDAWQRSGHRTFLLVWLGQTVSSFGTSLTSFALGVWVYLETGSTTRYALIAFFTIAPRVLILPLVGAIIDRYDRRRVMILSNVGAGFGTGVLALLLWSGGLEIWHIYVISAVNSLFRGFQGPAFVASTTLLVARRHFGRASALTHLGSAGTEILAPLSAGLLLELIAIHGVLLIDVSTFVFSALVLARVRIPMPAADEDQGGKKSAESRSLLKDSLYGWTYLRRRPGLMGLLGLFAVANFTIGSLHVLITPWVLSFASPRELGVVLSSAAAGQLVGSAAMSLWGGPRQRLYGVFGALAVQSLVLPLGILPARVALLSGIAFLYFCTIPVVASCNQALWQSKVAPGVQGRVFTIRRTCSMVLMPLAYLVVGPLADHVFEPAMAPGGALATLLGRILGIGGGRGIALMVALLGLFLLLSTALALAYRPVRRLEEELPDIVGKEDV